jgi:hypothetical protein
MSFGTPHDIASLHIQNKMDIPGQKDEGADNPVAGPGRPKKYGAFGRANSIFGRDPVGAKALDKTFTADKSPLQHKYRGGPLSTESKNLIQQLQKVRKSPKILKESLSDKKTDPDKGTILDEKNLISNEKA